MAGTGVYFTTAIIDKEIRLYLSSNTHHCRLSNHRLVETRRCYGAGCDVKKLAVAAAL